MQTSVIPSLNGYLHSLPVRTRIGDTVPLPQTYNPLRDILEWSPALVRNWVLGMGPEFKTISSEFYRQQVRGTELLQMGTDKLLTLGVSNVSQQETILLAVELLRNVTGVGSESTLVISQSLSVHISQLIQHLCAGLSPECTHLPLYPSGSDDTASLHLSVDVYESIHSVLSDVHSLICAIEQYQQPGTLLELTLGPDASWKQAKARLLSETDTLLNLLPSQGTDTRDKVMSALKACSSLSETLALLFNSFHHPPLSNHKATFIVVPLTSIPGSKLGFNLKTYRDGKIRISEVVPDSPAAKSKLLHVGDEVIRVRDQMIVSWELSFIICLFSENHSSLSLTIKSRLPPYPNLPPLILTPGETLDSSPSANRILISKSLNSFNSLAAPRGTADSLPNRFALSTGSEENNLRTHQPILRRMSLPSEARRRFNSQSLPQKPRERRLSDSEAYDENQVPPFSPTSPSQPQPAPQAYRTLVLGGVVTRIPITPEILKKKKDRGRIWKSISFRRSTHPSTSEPSSVQKASALTPLTESYQVKIINGVPHKFPAALAANKAKRKDKKNKKEKETRKHQSSNNFHASHSLESFRYLPEASMLYNGYSQQSLQPKKSISLSSSDLLSPEKTNSPHLQGKFIHRVTSNGEVEVELLSEVNDTLDLLSFENVPDELKVPCSSIRNPDCTGWLTKQGGSGLTPKNWRKRWFVLKGDNLYYYKSSFDFYALGKIYIPKYAVDSNNEVKKRRSFSLYHPLTRTYFMYADSEEEIQKWVANLSKISRPAFSNPTRVSSPSSDSNKDSKSKGSQNSI